MGHAWRAITPEELECLRIKAARDYDTKLDATRIDYVRELGIRHTDRISSPYPYYPAEWSQERCASVRREQLPRTDYLVYTHVCQVYYSPQWAALYGRTADGNWHLWAD